MSDVSEARLARLLAALPPAPAGWIEAAAELPRTRRELEDVMGRVEADERFRRQVAEDIDAALDFVAPERRPAYAALLRAHLDPEE